MSLVSDLKQIAKLNKFHARIVVGLLYFERFWSEKKKVLYLLVVLHKILRKLIVQGNYHCEISPYSFYSRSAIASLRLPHPFMIIVHREARIGMYTTLFHNVTIGVIEKGEHRRAPKLAEKGGIYIGTGATLLGDITVAEDVKIGAHSLILKSIESAGQTVVGVYK